MYLGVVPVVFDHGQARMEGEGKAAEYAVKMRRLPDQRMMPELLERGAIGATELRELAVTLCRFHDEVHTTAEIARFGTPEVVGGNWEENFQQTADFRGKTITQAQYDEIRTYVQEFLRDESDLFGRRIDEDHIRDCHGDLRSDAVCFDDPLIVYDCIEFNERFRFSDVASDLAFLVMDMEFRGHRSLADELAGLYMRISRDTDLPVVLNFYRCYRAYIRGKVDSFLTAEAEVPEDVREEAARRAQAYFRLAHDLTRREPARYRGPVICMAGVTGTGKSHVAYAFAARIGAVVLSTDVIRKQLAGVDPTDHSGGEELYSLEMTRKTYAEVHRRAEALLADGRVVILDATYLKRDHRQEVANMASAHDRPFLVVECQLDPDKVRANLQSRQADPTAVSDGKWDVYLRQRDGFEAVTEVPPDQHIVVQTDQPLGKLLDELEHAVWALAPEQI
jgi:aminoglycoside phosphotransferase family enzyme/predicted kinase